MKEQIEIKSLDLRYENYRLKSPEAEKLLLTSILENGIRDPLQGVSQKEKRILLNGFKRYRCAKKLGIGIVPYISIADDEAYGIIELIRASNAKGLNILEQAILIDELNTSYKMSNADMAVLLERSKSWVSVRMGLIQQMSDLVREKTFNGDFPVYSYMYTLRQFIRINSVKKGEIDEFVGAVSGKGLSIRDIEILANSYFKGSDNFREQIKSGNISWGLSRLKETFSHASGSTKVEQRMLKDLEIVLKYMQRVTNRSKDKRYKTGAFYSQANLLTGSILRLTDIFFKAIKDFHDQSGEAKGDLSSL